MRVQAFIIISLFASLILACSQKTKTESINLEVKEVTLGHTHIADDVSPPPPDLPTTFKTLHEWIFSMCDDEKPKKSIANYNFGLFESPNHNTMYVGGVNKYNKGDTSYTRIVFEPSNMYFALDFYDTPKANSGCFSHIFFSFIHNCYYSC